MAEARQDGACSSRALALGSQGLRYKQGMPGSGPHCRVQGVPYTPSQPRPVWVSGSGFLEAGMRVCTPEEARMCGLLRVHGQRQAHNMVSAVAGWGLLLGSWPDFMIEPLYLECHVWHCQQPEDPSEKNCQLVASAMSPRGLKGVVHLPYKPHSLDLDTDPGKTADCCCSNDRLCYISCQIMAAACLPVASLSPVGS